MAESDDIVLGLKIKDNEAKNSVKSLKSELRQLTNELANLEPSSEAFVKTAKRAGELRDKIDDAKNAVQAFNPEAKFQAFANVVGGVANGFAVAQGAMQLFGAENKNLQKMMAQTQGAIAIATGLNGLLGMGDSFKLLKAQLGDAVKGLFTLRGALIATGVGAIAVAVGTLVANWKEFSKALTTAFPSFKVVTDFFSNFRQIAVGTLKATVEGFKVIGDVVAKIFEGDFSGAIDSAKTFGERTAVAYNEGFEEEDKKIKIEESLKKRKFEIELEEAKGKDVLNKKLALQKDELKLLEKGSDEYNEKLLEIEKTRTEIRKRGVEEREKQNEKERKIYDDTIKRYKSEIDALIEKNKTAFGEIGKETEKREAEYSKYKTLLEKDLADTKYTNQEKSAEIEEFYKRGIISETDYLNYRKQIAASEEELEKKKQDARMQTLSATSSILNSVSTLLGKQTEEGKALAIAAATIDTYVSAVSAYKAAAKIDPIILAPLSAAAAIASGLANVNAIINTKVPKTSGGGSGASMPSVTRPSLPPMVRPSSNMVTIGNESIRTQSNGIDQKVYVVESDITNTQNKVKAIEDKATIG